MPGVGSHSSTWPSQHVNSSKGTLPFGNVKAVLPLGQPGARGREVSECRSGRGGEQRLCLDHKLLIITTLEYGLGIQ